MLTRRGFLFALIAGWLAGPSLFGALAGAAGNQTKCPVLGGAINRDVYVDHQAGGSISAARAVSMSSRKIRTST